jgi:mannosyltransferase
MEIATLALILILGAGLRFHGLSENGISNDEMLTVRYSSGRYAEVNYIKDNNTRLDIKLFNNYITMPVSIRPIKVAQDTYRYEPSHPPLYYMIVNISLAVLGVSEFTARLPSFVFGTLTILFVFLIGHRLHSTVVGLIAAGLCAAAPFQVFYSQEARMYEMLSFFSVASTWLLLELSFRSSEGRGIGRALWLAYTASIIVGAYTHLFFLFVIGAHLVFIMMMHRHDRQLLRRWVIAAGCSVLMVSLWFGIRLSMAESITAGIAWAEGSGGAMKVLESAANTFLGMIWTPDVRPYKFKWVWIILIAFGFLKSLKPARLLLVPILVFFTPVCMILVDLLFNTHTTSIDRYYSAAAPALYLLLAIGISAVRPKPVIYLVVVVVLGHLAMGGYLTGEGRVYPREEFNKAAQELVKAGPDQRLVVVSRYPDSPAGLLAYYLGNYRDRPGTIDLVLASDLDQLKMADLFSSERKYSNLTVVISNWDTVDLTKITERFDSQTPSYLKFEGIKRYHGLSVLSFRPSASRV